MTRPLFAHLLFSAVTSALMSLLVCAVAAYRLVGASAAFMEVWSGTWLFAWPIAFVALVSIGPLVRRTVYWGCKCPMAVPVENGRKAP